MRSMVMHRTVADLQPGLVSLEEAPAPQPERPFDVIVEAAAEPRIAGRAVLDR